MRVWHHVLIPFLPRAQLVAQWRELSTIAGNIKTKGTPNHILVNKVLDYDFDHFISYAYYIREEMTKRGYRTMDSVWNKIVSLKPDYNLLPINSLFPNWHNARYFKQCFLNLEEKYDCGAITEKEWERLLSVTATRMYLEYC